MQHPFIHRLCITATAIYSLSCAAPVPKAPPAGATLIPVVHDAGYEISLVGLEKLHPFDIAKYRRIRTALESDGLLGPDNLHSPDVLSTEDLLLVHTEAYLKSLRSSSQVAAYLEAPQVRHLPSPLVRRGVVNPFILASGGTLKAARLALKHEAAINLGGGYHHAKPDSGEGFCIIADIPIAIRKLQKEGKIKRALVVDTDIHQGNGTIVCLANDPTTFTFSIHEDAIYPHPKEQGDSDVTVPAGTGDDTYLKLLKHWLPKIIDRSQPDIVFHVSGCDALAGDPLANGRLTNEGIRQRDAYIVDSCKKRNIPYVMTLAGGYSEGAWKAQYLSIAGMMNGRD